MNTTPLWVPLVVAGLGLVGTAVAGLGGVWLTQRRADRREDLIWQRQLQREQSQWTREDAMRTFENRREAYLNAYNSLNKWGEDLVRYADDADDLKAAGLPADGGSVRAALDAVEVYGSPMIVELSEDAREIAALLRYEIDRTGEFSGDRLNRWVVAMKNLLKAIREEMGIPNQPSPDDDDEYYDDDES
jgi:hypothetical protein